MPSGENRIIVACAGSGKTRRLVTDSLREGDRRIAIVTYTTNNTREIGKRFAKENSGIPKHVDVMTWFEFLLRECARPYQNAKYSDERIESLLFVNSRSTKWVREANARGYYFAGGNLIYSDKIAAFVIECEKESEGAVSRRLGRIYSDVFIDECQDLAGWDLDVIRMLLESNARVTLVGDPRQHIYSTNPAAKNRQYLGGGLVNLVRAWEREGLCTIEHMNTTYRCNGSICEFANRLWPGMDAMVALRTEETGHDGVFLVAEDVVKEYVARFRPQVLRYAKTAETYGCDALNFGLSKGLEFQRVLIIPTGPIKKYLLSGELGEVKKARDKLHVAVTRASDSVAFVCDGASPVVSKRWEP